MNTQTDTYDLTTSISRERLWTARVLCGLPAAFLLLDSGVKLLRLPPAVTATVQLGYPPNVLIGLGSSSSPASSPTWSQRARCWVRSC